MALLQEDGKTFVNVKGANFAIVENEVSQFCDTPFRSLVLVSSFKG